MFEKRVQHMIINLLPLKFLAVFALLMEEDYLLKQNILARDKDFGLRYSDQMRGAKKEKFRLHFEIANLMALMLFALVVLAILKMMIIYLKEIHLWMLLVEMAVEIQERHGSNTGSERASN